MRVLILVAALTAALGFAGSARADLVQIHYDYGSIVADATLMVRSSPTRRWMSNSGRRSAAREPSLAAA